jgi:hypothetical protein
MATITLDAILVSLILLCQSSFPTCLSGIPQSMLSSLGQALVELYLTQEFQMLMALYFEV